MSIIGDLERLFATSLYPLRVPIAIGLAIVAIALLVVARRRRWDQAAWRHPRRTAAALAFAIVVGGPLAWYLGSPLFIRTELVEAGPGTDSGAGGQTSGAVIAGGTFSGADEFHFGRGKASLVEIAPGQVTLRFEEFSVRNGPDLYVYLSPDAEGYADGALELGTLKATDGAFNYEIPAGMDLSGYQSVVVWCKQFAVQFAHAPLSPA